MSESDIAEFPLPADATAEERAQAKREIARYTEIVGEEPRSIKLRGKLLGKTGPNWHFQYTRIYQVPKGYLAAAHDIRAGIAVSFADELAHVADGFENEGVREFIVDELRFRKVLDAEPARAH
ncbi:MAG TPA: hypothetical protein VGA38_12795 [Candidatus Limnocylindria bacterium]